MRLTPQQVVYVRSMGKTLRVTAIFTDESEASAYQARHRGEVQVARFGSVIFIANAYDPGTPIGAAA